MQVESEGGRGERNRDCALKLFWRSSEIGSGSLSGISSVVGHKRMFYLVFV